jgi:hypothetical protein
MVGVLMSVKPRTDSVTSMPIDQLMLFIVVENTIGRTKGKCSWRTILPVPMPENTAWRVNSRVLRLMAMDRISRAS